MKNMLKELILAIALTGAVAAQSPAQVVTKGSSHINVGYEVPDYLDAFISLPMLSLSTAGPFTASYQYAFRDRIATGIQLGYLQGKTPEITINDPATGIPHLYQATYGALTVMAKADYHYIRHNKLDLYSGLSAGVGFGIVRVLEKKQQTNSFSADLFVWHLRLAGVRYMVTEHIGAFAEAGMFTTYVNGVVGVSAKFGGKQKEERKSQKRNEQPDIK